MSRYNKIWETVEEELGNKCHDSVFLCIPNDVDIPAFVFDIGFNKCNDETDEYVHHDGHIRASVDAVARIVEFSKN